MKRKLISLLLLLTLLLTACGGEKGATVRVALGGPVTALDPAFAETGASASAILHVYDNLLRVTADGNGGTKLTGAAALSWETVDNYDGTVTYVFTLSPDAVWSDGEPVTAEDFIYAWQRLVAEKTASPHAELLAPLKGYDEAIEQKDPTALAMEADEDGKLRVTLAWHCPYFLRSVCAAAPTVPLRQDVVERYGEDWGSKRDAIVGNGSYTVSGWDTEGLTLTRRDGVPETAPYTLSFLPARTVAAAEQLLADGAADFISPIGGESFLRVSAEADYTPVPIACAISVRFGSCGACTDAALRRALFAATDYTAVTACFEGKPVTPAGGLVPDGILTSEGKDFRTENGIKTDVRDENRDYREETVRTAMREAESAPESLSLIYPVENTELSRLATALASAWKEMTGLAVKVEPLTAEDFADATEAGTFDCALVETDTDIADAMSFLSWYGGTDGEDKPRVSEGYSTLVSIAMGALDERARDSYLFAAENELISSCAAIPVAFRGVAYEKAPALHNVAYDGVGNWLFHGAAFG